MSLFIVSANTTYTALYVCHLHVVTVYLMIARQGRNMQQTMNIWCSKSRVRTDIKYRNCRHKFPAVCVAVNCSVCWVNTLCGLPSPSSGTLWWRRRQYLPPKVISSEAGSSQFAVLSRLLSSPLGVPESCCSSSCSATTETDILSEDPRIFMYESRT